MATAKRKRKPVREEVFGRSVLISSIAPSVRCHVEGDKKDPDPTIETRAWLELRAEMTEPVRDVKAISLSVWGDPHFRIGTVRPLPVAHIIRTRPTVEVIAAFAVTDFSYIWSLALSGRLTHAYLSFAKPRYGSAPVFSISFSTEFEE